MMKTFIYSTFLLLTVGFTSCETADETIAKMDTLVPDVTVQNDSITVIMGQKYTVNFEAEDPSGIKRIDISYSDWNIGEVIDFAAKEDYPERYTHSIDFTVPTAWTSKVATGYYKDGTSYLFTQYYHKIEIKVTDTKLNVRKIYAYLMVQ